MRTGGGRTSSRGSLRGERKTSGRKAAAVGTGRRLRSGSGAPKPDPRRLAISRPKANEATAVELALNASSAKSTPTKKKHQRLEAFVPLQRHLYGEEKIFLPCPQSRKEIPGKPR